MKIVRILIVLIVIVVVAVSAYFYLGRVERPRMKLRTYLDENAVLYHQFDNKTVKQIARWSGLGDEAQRQVLTLIADSSRVGHVVRSGSTLVSWHLTRQNNLEPLYWFFTDDDYVLSGDTLFNGKSVGNLTEVKSANKFFIAEGHQLLLLGADGELMEQAAAFELFADSALIKYPRHQFEGNVKKATKFLKHASTLFQNIEFNAGHFRLTIQPVNNAVYYNLLVDSLPNLCGEINNDGFNKKVPVSAQSAIQYKFRDASCIRDNLNEKLSQILWDAEDRYQFKFGNLVEAWVEGSVTWMHCNFIGLKEDIAMVKLRYDAAPFATGNRFFSEYETIKIQNGNNAMNYTIARMLPNELSQILFSNAQTSQKLYVTQLKDHLYFSPSKKALLMLLNELVNGQYLQGFSKHRNNVARIFVRFPEIMNSKQKQTPEYGWIIEGYGGLTGSGLVLQGSVFSTNN